MRELSLKFKCFGVESYPIYTTLKGIFSQDNLHYQQLQCFVPTKFLGHSCWSVYQCMTLPLQWHSQGTWRVKGTHVKIASDIWKTQSQSSTWNENYSENETNYCRKRSSWLPVKNFFVETKTGANLNVVHVHPNKIQTLLNK